MGIISYIRHEIKLRTRRGGYGYLRMKGGDLGSIDPAGWIDASGVDNLVYSPNLALGTEH